MKFMKRFLALSLALCLSLPMTVFAYSVDTATYNNIMTSVVANCMISCQPASALTIQNTTVIADNMKSPNYTAGVFDLPRLTPNYYWDIPTDEELGVAGNNDKITTYGIIVPQTVYPVIAITGQDLPDQTSFSICVRAVGTEEVVKVINIMSGGIVHRLETSFADCSDKLLEKLLDNNAKRYNMTTTVYDPIWHKNCVVMPNYIVTSDSNLTAGMPIASATYNWDTFDVVFTGYSSENDIIRNIHFNAGNSTNASGSQQAAGLALFTESTAVKYDRNKHLVTTDHTKIESATPANTNYKGAYAIFLETGVETYGVKNEKLDMLKAQQVQAGARLIEMPAGEAVDILSQISGITEISKYDVEISQIDPTITMDENYNFTYSGNVDKQYNVNHTASAFGGYNLHVATLDCKAFTDSYIVHLWYSNPETSEITKLGEVIRSVGDVKNITETPPDNWSNWQFEAWCSDKNATTPINPATYFANAQKNDTFNLYAKFKYIGGVYKVQFYNDSTEQTTTEQYECRNQPTLPTVSDRTGYLFKNWQIVDTVASTSGTPYDPAAFVPTKDNTYIFKTFWDINGVIKNVLSNKTDYFIGDTIDKTKVVVTVQDTNDGATRTLSTSEFNVSPTTVTKAGTNQIQVTYTKTGATATFDVTGKEVTPTTLKATYSGGSITVGEAVPKNSIQCVVNYNNGTSKTISASDFSVSPATIANAGTNMITVKYQDMSTTVSITGTKKSVSPSASPSVNQTLQSIAAIYKGGTPYVGDVIEPSSLQVTAKYTDNTSKVLSSTDFVYTPSYIKYAGSNVISVTYGGKTTTVTIEAKEKSTVTNKPTGTGTANTTSGSSLSKDTSTKISTSSSNSSSTTTGSSSTTTGKDKKGTSTGYLNGANILHMGSLASDTSVTNSTDILSEIASAGSNATSVTIDLYNGAEGNDITEDMLTALSKKKLTLNINMKSPADNTTVGRWVIDGKSMKSTNFMINPNITFDKISKGSETLYYMAIVNIAYPDSVQLTITPELSAYDTGKVVRLYSCSMFRDNTKLMTTLRWSDESNPLPVSIYESTSWCLSDAAEAYMNGSSLESNTVVNENTTVTDSKPSADPTTEEEEEEESFDFEEESFDFEDESFDFETGSDDISWTGSDTTSQTGSGQQTKKSSVPLIIMLSALGILLVGGGIGAFFFVKSKGAFNMKDTDEYEDDEDIEDIGYDDDDSDEFDEDDQDKDVFEDDDEYEDE